jgi:deoxycytidylate deaminase
MILLKNKKELEEARNYLEEAVKVALSSSCHRSKCGSVIVSEGKIIGKGFNSPPKNKVLKDCFKDNLPEDFKSDKTCCIHAEQRAILDALKNNPNKIENSRIYFIRLNEQGNKIPADKPYCTICSKMALDVGISKWVLLHDKGIYVYDSEEYNQISFGLKKWKI